MPRRLSRNAIVYIAKYDKSSSPGIHKKVGGTLEAAAAMGYRVRSLNEEFEGAPRLRHVFRAIIDAREQYLIFRSFAESNLFLLPALVFARWQGKTVIVDVPTPASVAAHELWQQRGPLSYRAYRIMMLYMGGPWSLWPATTIIQHASEGWWFSIGNRGRTLKLGNGIDMKLVRLRRKSPVWPADTLRLVAVATLSTWHGYDLLIRAVAEWNSRPHGFRVSLTLIGDGRARSDLEELVSELAQESAVRFTGMLDQHAIATHFEHSHLAVGSLGGHRKGLMESSTLKAREYCAAGIPFIAGGPDPDFPDALPFRFEVALDESIDDLLAAFRKFAGAEIPSPTDIRAYAAANLSYESKLRRLGFDYVV